MKDKTLVVPIDERGIYDYENDISKTDRLKFFVLSRKEFNSMMSDGFFDLLNNKFDLWIDDYEEEIISNEYLISVKQLIESYSRNYPDFFKALNYAIQCNTELCLEF